MKFRLLSVLMVAVLLMAGSARADTASDLAEAKRDFETAVANWGDGKSANAEALLNQSLAIRERILGPNHGLTGDVVERLGAIDFNRRNYKAAEAKFRRALDIYLTGFGERSMATSVALGDLGAALRDQRRFREAEPYVQRSLAIRRALLPANSQPIASSLENLSRIYVGEHRFSDARDTFTEKLHIDQNIVPYNAQNVARDQALLKSISDDEQKSSRLIAMVLWSGFVAIIFTMLLAMLTVAREKQLAADPEAPPPRFFAPGRAVLALGAFGGFAFAAMFALDDAIAVLVPWIFGDSSNAGGIGKIGFFIGIFLANLAVQAVNNRLRKAAGLTLQPIKYFAGRPSRAAGGNVSPSAMTPQADDDGTRWFAAMTYYAGMLNRTYKVFITDKMLSGAAVRGLVASPPITSPAELDSQLYWVNTRSALAYKKIDPESEDFLAFNRSNFQIAWSEVSGFDYLPQKKWGMGNVPHSGRLIVRLKSGKSRELILLGNQDGNALKDMLDSKRERSRVAA